MTDSLQSNETIRTGLDVITHRAFREHGRFVKAAGLTIPQFGILIQLYYQQQCGMSDISSRMDISGAAASQLVDKLFQAGLLERSEDPADRRVKQLRLTEKGRKLVEAGMAERHSWVDALVARLEPAEREKVAEAMNILTGAIQQVIEQDKSVME
jgi:DNA-binding MarR family transcriptional regulator